MKNKPTISIALATYNGAKYLQEQLDSYLRQTLLPDELVVCDDCSIDNTVEILRAFQASAPFSVKIILNDKNYGYSKTFSNALSATGGEFVFLSDQDDVWFPERLKTIISAYKADDNIQMLISDAVITDERLVSQNKNLFTADQKQFKSYDSAIHGCCISIRRDFLLFVLPVPYCFTHDKWLNYVGRELNIRHILNKPLMYYRRHSKAVTYESLGIKKTILQDICFKIQKNYRAFYRKSSMDFFLSEYCKVSSTLDLLHSLKASRETLPWYCHDNIEKLQSVMTSKAKAFEQRKKILNQSYLSRIRPILSAYRRGVYEHFHGFQTAMDDLIRSNHS